MSIDYDKEISQIKEKLDNAKNMRIRAEARLEQLNKQKQELTNEIESLGVKPEKLENEIVSLKNEIDEMLKKIKDMLSILDIKNN